MVLTALPEWFCLMLLGTGMLLTCPFLTEVCFGVYEWWGGTGEVGDGGVGGGGWGWSRFCGNCGQTSEILYDGIVMHSGCFNC